MGSGVGQVATSRSVEVVTLVRALQVVLERHHAAGVCGDVVGSAVHGPCQQRLVAARRLSGLEARLVLAETAPEPSIHLDDAVSTTRPGQKLPQSCHPQVAIVACRLFPDPFPARVLLTGDRALNAIRLVKRCLTSRHYAALGCTGRRAATLHLYLHLHLLRSPRQTSPAADASSILRPLWRRQ